LAGLIEGLARVLGIILVVILPIAVTEDCTHDMSARFGPDFKGIRYLTNQKHVQGEYNLKGLPEYRTKSAGFKCPGCGVTVLMSKQPVDLGGGIKLVLISCRCQSVAATLRNDKVRLRLTPENWLDPEARDSGADE